MKEWFRGLLRGQDGETSLSNLLMFVGLGLPIVLAVPLLVFDVIGIRDWPEVPMDWFTAYTIAVILPYIFKKWSYRKNAPE